MSIEALLLAASTVGVTIWRSRTTGEDAGYARILADGCTRLTVLLSIGGVAAWLDLFARSATQPGNALEVIQAGVLLVVLFGLPWVARQIAKGASD
ncbi:hypothetical protein [Paraconexibacter algicola]|nr:hypothetical protein [Paraconexibacter algicola]